MIVLVEKMRNEKNITQPVRELIIALKLEYNNIGLFENKGAAVVEEIMQTIPESKGTAWQKYLEGKLILDTEDYNMIVESMVLSRLFQEGHLHEKINKNILGPESEEIKEEVMARCTLLFENVAKAHEANRAVAKELKELSTLIKDPRSFLKDSTSSDTSTGSLLFALNGQIYHAETDRNKGKA